MTDCRFIEDIVANEEAAGIPSSQVVVGGFSQGGAVAMMAARSTKKLGGIVGLCPCCVLCVRGHCFGPAA